MPCTFQCPKAPKTIAPTIPIPIPKVASKTGVSAQSKQQTHIQVQGPKPHSISFISRSSDSEFEPQCPNHPTPFRNPCRPLCVQGKSADLVRLPMLFRKTRCKCFLVVQTTRSFPLRVLWALRAVVPKAAVARKHEEMLMMCKVVRVCVGSLIRLHPGKGSLRCHQVLCRLFDDFV